MLDRVSTVEAQVEGGEQEEAEPQGSASWLRRAATALAVLACLAPIVASVVHVGRGWVPVSDTAIIATRARDVFTADSPLLGQPSTAGATVGEQVHHPGPLEYWVIAAAQQVGDHRVAPLVAIAVVNAAAVLSILWWVRALGGTGAVLLAAVPLVTMLWSLRGVTLVDPLNPYAAVVPFAAHLVALVAVARGRQWALLTAVLAGSWAAQAHLTVTGLVVVSSAVTLAALAVRRFRGGRDAGRGRIPSRAAVAALVALALCWAGPVLDVLSHDGGNVRALAATSGAVPAPPGSDRVAVDRAVQALTWRPVWADADASLPRLLTTPTDRDLLLVAALWLAGFVAAVANRRRAPALGLAFAIATVVVLTGTALLSRLPGSFFNIFQAGNYLWLWPSGAMLWSASVAGVLLLLHAHRRAGAGSAPAVLLALPLCAAVAVAVASVAEPSNRTVRRDGPAYVSALGRDLAGNLDPGQTYGLNLSLDLEEQVVDVGLVLELERRGFDIRVPEEYAPSFAARATGLADTGATLILDLGREVPEPPGEDATLVGSYQPPARLSQRLDRAEQAVAERVDRSGGVEALIPQGFGLEVPATALDFVRDDLLGMMEIGIIPREVSSWPETEELVAVRALPVQHAVVHLLPGSPAGPGGP